MHSVMSAVTTAAACCSQAATTLLEVACFFPLRFGPDVGYVACQKAGPREVAEVAALGSKPRMETAVQDMWKTESAIPMPSPIARNGWVTNLHFLGGSSSSIPPRGPRDGSSGSRCPGMVNWEKAVDFTPFSGSESLAIF